MKLLPDLSLHLRVCSPAIQTEEILTAPRRPAAQAKARGERSRTKVSPLKPQARRGDVTLDRAQSAAPGINALPHGRWQHYTFAGARVTESGSLS